MKKIILAALGGLAFLAAPSPIFAKAGKSSISLTLSGRIGCLLNRDWFVSIPEDDLIAVNEVMGPGTTLAESRYGIEKILPGLGLELLLPISNPLSLGLGINYTPRKWTLAGRYERKSAIPEDLATYDVSRTFSIHAFSFYAAASLRLLYIRNTDLSLVAGLSYNVLCMDYRYRLDHGFRSFWSGQKMMFRETITSEDARAGHFGFHMGFEAAGKLTGHLALTLSALFSHVPFGKVRGNLQDDTALYNDGRLNYQMSLTTRGIHLNAGKRFSLTSIAVQSGLRFLF